MPSVTQAVIQDVRVQDVALGFLASEGPSSELVTDQAGNLRKGSLYLAQAASFLQLVSQAG